MCVTGVGIDLFVFNIGHVCYRCGDLQVCVLCRNCVLQVMGFESLCLI